MSLYGLKKRKKNQRDLFDIKIIMRYEVFVFGQKWFSKWPPGGIVDQKSYSKPEPHIHRYLQEFKAIRPSISQVFVWKRNSGREKERKEQRNNQRNK